MRHPSVITRHAGPTPGRQTSTQGSSGLLIAASPPHQAWFSPTMDSSLCLHSVVPSVTFSSGLTCSCLQQLRAPAAVLSCSSQLHLTLCPCCCSKLQCHSPRLSMFPPGDLSYPAHLTPAALHPLVVLGQRCGAKTHLQHGAVQPYSNQSRNWWVGFSYPWCEGT